MLRPLLLLFALIAVPGVTTTSNSICTVTGPTVIDFSSHLDYVEDRCEYQLLKIEGVSVVGRFLERRRRNVNFLDSVSVQLNNNNINLQQVDVVQVNNAPLDLSAPQTVANGVVVSKDQTGVTVVIQINNVQVTIFFDGNTAVINVEGSTGSPLEGLCANSSSEAKLPGCNSINCVPHYNINETICANNTKSCLYLKEEPFTSCDIDPQPYVDACTDLLSTYPAVDGLKCQFLTAYAKACSLYNNITVQDWKFKTKCYGSRAFNFNKTCNQNEFCGESYTGEYTCLCRANFACEIRNDYTYGHPVCSKHQASLTLYNCLLEEENIDYTGLHLNDPSCTGQLDVKANTVTFTFKSDTCGTQIIDNGTSIIYKNAIVSQNETGVIIRHDTVRIDFSCYQTQPGLLSKSFTVMNSDYKGVIVSGPWNYTLDMKAYVDDGCVTLVDSNTQIKLNQQVWIKLTTEGLDKDLVVLVIDHCWATAEPSSTSEPNYDLIKNSCPSDPTVVIRGNGKQTFTSFAFDMFEFLKGSNKIYLHCAVHLCVKSTNTCKPTCPTHRRRRSVSSEHESPALISMGWTS